MARNTVITVLLVIASLLLAIALFIAGAMWRGKVTSGQASRDGFSSIPVRLRLDPWLFHQAQFDSIRRNL